MTSAPDGQPAGSTVPSLADCVDGPVLRDSPATARRAARFTHVESGPVVTTQQLQTGPSEQGILGGDSKPRTEASKQAHIQRGGISGTETGDLINIVFSRNSKGSKETDSETDFISKADGEKVAKTGTEKLVEDEIPSDAGLKANNKELTKTGLLSEIPTKRLAGAEFESNITLETGEEAQGVRDIREGRISSHISNLKGVVETKVESVEVISQKESEGSLEAEFTHSSVLKSDTRGVSGFSEASAGCGEAESETVVIIHQSDSQLHRETSDVGVVVDPGSDFSRKRDEMGDVCESLSDVSEKRSPCDTHQTTLSGFKEQSKSGDFGECSSESVERESTTVVSDYSDDSQCYSKLKSKADELGNQVSKSDRKEKKTSVIVFYTGDKGTRTTGDVDDIVLETGQRKSEWGSLYDTVLKTSHKRSVTVDLTASVEGDIPCHAGVDELGNTSEDRSQVRPPYTHSTHTDIASDDRSQDRPSYTHSTHTDIASEDSSQVTPSYTHSTHTDITSEGRSQDRPSYTHSTHTDIASEDRSHNRPSYTHSTHTDIASEDSPQVRPSYTHSTHTDIASEDRSHNRPPYTHSTHTDIASEERSQVRPSYTHSTHTDIASEDRSHNKPSYTHSTHTDIASEERSQDRPPYTHSTHTDIASEDRSQDRPSYTHSTRTDIASEDKSQVRPSYTHSTHTDIASAAAVTPHPVTEHRPGSYSKQQTLKNRKQPGVGIQTEQKRQVSAALGGADGHSQWQESHSRGSQTYIHSETERLNETNVKHSRHEKSVDASFNMTSSQRHKQQTEGGHFKRCPQSQVHAQSSAVISADTNTLTEKTEKLNLGNFAQKQTVSSLGQSAKQRTADIVYGLLAGGQKSPSPVEVYVANVKESVVVSHGEQQHTGSRPARQRPANILLLLSHWDSFEKKCVDDGPVSVQQEPVENSMYTNLQDAPGNQSASKAAPPSHSSSNQNKPSGQMDRPSTNQNSTEVNGSLVEDRKNLKHLPMEDVLEKVKAVVMELDRFTEYNKPEVMQLQKCLGDFYWDYTSHRREIGDAIAEAGYAAITVRILKGLNTIGIFKNDDVWFPTYYTYNTTWNYSDCSELLAKNLAEADAVRLLTLNCGHKPYLSAVHSKNVYYVIKASMSILHNIARNPTAKTFFKENKTSEVIMPFITMNDDMLKVLAMLTLAYIVEEEDNVKLIDETGTIKNIVLWIEKALESPKRRFKGFCPMELTQGLDKLAVNDGNKSRIIEEGAIPLFMKMLLHDDPREHSVTARCIWTLSFDKGVRQKLIDYESLVPTLEKLADSSEKDVHKNASGALWILKGEIDPTSERPKSAVKAKTHIFISYTWSDQKQAKEILERLKAEGYSVWIDIEQMGGSTLEAMAGAIENAAVVLVCMSEKYKQSPNCRTEAEYTFQLRKDYIPLMMQRKYRPDGWLGLILGAKLFFDFSGKYPFDKSMSGLLKELRGRGQRGVVSTQPSVDEVDAPTEVCTTVDTLKGNPHHSTHPLTGSTVPGTAHMSKEDVQKWLMGNQLENCMTLFNQFDGRLVWQLKEMKQEAPDYFYQCLERRLNLGLIDMLKLAAALNQIN